MKRIKPQKVKFEFCLGERVVDIVTGFRGMITAQVRFFNGCIQYRVSPRVDEKGIIPDGVYIDETQLLTESEYADIYVPEKSKINVE